MCELTWRRSETSIALSSWHTWLILSLLRLVGFLSFAAFRIFRLIDSINGERVSAMFFWQRCSRMAFNISLKIRGCLDSGQRNPYILKYSTENFNGICEISLSILLRFYIWIWKFSKNFERFLKINDNFSSFGSLLMNYKLYPTSIIILLFSYFVHARSFIFSSI